MLTYFFLFIALIGLISPQLAANILLKGQESREAIIFIRILCAVLLITVLAVYYFSSRALS